MFAPATCLESVCISFVFMGLEEKVPRADRAYPPLSPSLSPSDLHSPGNPLIPFP